MGRSSEFICKDCKIKAYLGYGSATTWMDQYKTLKDFDEAPDPQQNRKISKNKAFREMLQAHEGHDWTAGDDDYRVRQNGNLYFEDPLTGGLELLIEGYETYVEVVPHAVAMLR